MKIRNGFVSNSSSSSFCIYGIGMNRDSYGDIENSIKGTCLEIEYGDQEDRIYIGRSWSNVQDNETGAEFKMRIEKAIKEKFNIDANECGTIEKSWYNG